MMHNLLLSSLLITAASAAPYGPFNFFSSETPSNGANGNLGGLFGVPVPVPAVPTPVAYIINVLADYITFPDPNALAAYLNIDQILGYAFAKPSEYPRSQISVKDFYDPGTGPYPAHFFTDPGLPNHVIYAPKTPPPQELKMPTMVWGNGLCLSSGTAYGPFLMEIASHGYIVIATGPVGAPPPSVVLPSGILPGPNGEVRDPKEGQVLNGFSSVQDMLDSIKFVADGKLDRLGNVDKDSFITAGSSCGGLEAYSAAYKNDKVKLIGVYNSGTLLSGRQKYVKELKNRVAYISGGPEDVSWQNGLDDMAVLPMSLPVYRADLNSGHLGTFFAKNGGKYGEASVALFNWVFRGDENGKRKWTDPKSQGSLSSQGWNVTWRNVI